MGAEQVFELASRGGAVIWVLLVFSLVALAIVVLKLYQFAQLRIWSDGGIEAAIAALRAGDRAAALGLARAGTGPVARIVAVALIGVALVSAGYGGLLEWFQSTIPVRVGSVSDAVIDTVGAIVGVIAVVVALRFIHRGHPAADPQQ